MFAAHFDALSFFLIIFALTLSPGADSILVIRNTLRGGRLDGMITTLSICSGLFIHATVSALGVAALIAASPTAFVVLKTAGALYLAWLGISSLRASFAAYLPFDTRVQAARLQWAKPIREGFLSNVLNPKTSAVYLAILPQFIEPASAWSQSMVLASLHFVLSVVWLGLIVIFVQAVKARLIQDAGRRWLDRVFGLSLIGLGLMLLMP